MDLVLGKSHDINIKNRRSPQPSELTQPRLAEKLDSQGA